MNILLIFFSFIFVFTFGITTAQQTCQNKPFGYKIIDDIDCHGYYLCHGNMTLKQYCAPGLKFAEEAQNCIIGTCPPCNCLPVPTPTPSPTTSTTTRDPTEPDCQNLEHGLRLPHIYNCRFFWQCVSGQAVKLFCQIGMWYDREHYVCNLRNAVKNCPANQD